MHVVAAFIVAVLVWGLIMILTSGSVIVLAAAPLIVSVIVAALCIGLELRR